MTTVRHITKCLLIKWHHNSITLFAHFELVHFSLQLIQPYLPHSPSICVTPHEERRNTIPLLWLPEISIWWGVGGNEIIGIRTMISSIYILSCTSLKIVLFSSSNSLSSLSNMSSKSRTWLKLSLSILQCWPQSIWKLTHSLNWCWFLQVRE